MKRIIFRALLFTLISVLCPSSIQSQTPFFTAKLIGGINFSQVDGDRFSGYNKIGFNGGVGIYHNFKNGWNGGFEILYSTKGSKLRIDPEDPNPRIFIIKSQYIEFPLLASYTLPNVEALSFAGGLSIGVNTGGTVDDGIVREANFKKTEIAFHLGGAYQVSEKVALQIRHSTSLFRVGEVFPNGLNWFNRVGLYNRLYMLSAKYTL